MNKSLISMASYPDDVKDIVAINNAAAIEISKETRLPIACIYLCHPAIPGMHIDSQQILAPLLLCVTDRKGNMFNILEPAPFSLIDLKSNKQRLDGLASYFFDDVGQEKMFFERGRMAIRVMSIETAVAFPLTQTPNHVRQEMLSFLDNEWRGKKFLEYMPESFSQIHEKIHKYSRGGCWYYAEALARTKMDGSKAVVLTLAAKTPDQEMAGQHHACLKTRDNRYEDIWGNQSIQDIADRFSSRIIKEELLDDFLENNKPNQHEFDKEVEAAMRVVRSNPVHQIQHKSHKTIISP